ncbi:MAG: hypothetical protein H5U00_08300 [Clostridia bacterium]|nr:hypothetical protein [Clostridia bacterium]
MYDPYAYLPRPFARAVDEGRLHLYCEFCARRHKGACIAINDPVGVWAKGDCWAYTENYRDVLLAEWAIRKYALRKKRLLLVGRSNS